MSLIYILSIYLRPLPVFYNLVESEFSVFDPSNHLSDDILLYSPDAPALTDVHKSFAMHKVDPG